MIQHSFPTRRSSDLEPVAVANLANVTRVSAGLSHTLAVLADGTVWAWGENDYGQLGDRTTTDRLVPVQVTGYTDTSGSVPYNQRLSQRRAKHVADVLVRMGVPPQALAIAGAGENNLAVPTPDGVREPRNRRVTIVE